MSDVRLRPAQVRRALRRRLAWLEWTILERRATGAPVDMFVEEKRAIEQSLEMWEVDRG